MSIVAPTTKDRIASLDVLRGAAILGILLANIFAFGGPVLGEQFGFDYHIPGTNDWFEGLRIALVTGKFRGLFCLLFGIGMYMQYMKLESRGAWPSMYLKRNGWLMLIGLIHALLIWFGDILFMYSALAFLAMWFVKFSDKVLLITASIMLACIFMVGLAGVGFMMAMASTDADMWAGGMGSFFEMFEPKNEIAVYQAGTYLQQFTYRAIGFVFVLFSLPIIGLEIVAIFFIGIYLARTGVLTKPSANPVLTRNLLLIGGAGLVLNLLAGATYPVLEFAYAQFLPELGLNVPLTIGYAILGAILVERSPKGIFARLMTPVGRTALTCYLLTSVICTTYYYSYGFGQFGQQTYFQMLGFVVVVWAILIVFAHLWLSKFPMGPVEHLWRRASYGKPLTEVASDSPDPDPDASPPVFR